MKKKIFFLLFLVFFPCLFFAQENSVSSYDVIIDDLPQFTLLNNKDKLFMEYLEKNEESNKKIYKKQPVVPEFYKYMCKKEDTIIKIAARFSIRQETLATLNRIETPTEDLEGTVLIVCDANGIFVPEKCILPYEIILKNRINGDFESRENEEAKKKSPLPAPVAVILTENGKSQKFDFYLDEKLGSAERAYFLDSKMQLPLEKSIITSTYGYRTSPISGRWIFHNGIDLAAPLGSNVYACKNGVVLKCGFDEIYGNHILISHGGGKTSLYAHLSKILVKENENVKTGKKIGEVGTTGLSTGPHLHFEYSENGKTKNPQELLKF